MRKEGCLGKDPILIVGKNFTSGTRAFLGRTFHEALKLNRAMFTGEVTITGTLTFRARD
jgi:hypothetical protein